MKNNNSFFILIIFLTISYSRSPFLFSKLSNMLHQSPSRAWCWTKYTDKNIDPLKGGYNWGYCKLVPKVRKKVRYNVYILTSTIPGSATNSNVYITLKGEDGVSSERLLSNKGFKLGSYIKKEIFTEDVGSLKAIQLRIEENSSYRCNTLRVEKSLNYWNFECNTQIKCPKCKEEIKLSHLITYDLTIKTRDIEDAGTLENIYIQFIGKLGKTPEKLISDKGFSKGSKINVSIDSQYVGLIKGISLSIKGYDNWRPEYINIRYIYGSGYQEHMFKFPISSSLSDPNNPLNNFISRSQTKKNSVEEDLIFDKEIRSIKMLNPDVIDLECNDILKGNDNFGPNFVTQQVNYKQYIAYCPFNCYQSKTRGIGLGIHPEEAPICISAIVDRGISLYGGYFTISIFNGLNSYTGGKKILGFAVLPYGPSMRSYTISKINNIDLIEKDVRIIDNYGKPSFIGRVEMRHQGIWGSVCAVGLDPIAAKIICIEQGYKKGKFLNPPPYMGRKFCSNFKGMNYCGAPQSRIMYSKFKCQGNEKSILECYRELADTSFCTHEYDTLIQCMNSTPEESIYYEQGTVYLMNHKNEYPENGIGRLNILLNGRWGTVCNKGFTDISARVACRQMGFVSGKVLRDPYGNAIECRNIFGNNMCGDLTTPIIMSNVECENTISDQKLMYCQYERKTKMCTHFDDVILQCEGFGDSTGRSQNLIPEKIENPLYEKMPMLPVYSAKCDSNAYQMNFRGDPGSVFLINCPKRCSELEKSIVSGTGIYTLNSSICRAAIHSGIITDDGGKLILTKTYGQNNYNEGLMRGISSIGAKKNLISFVLSKSLLIYETLSRKIRNSSFIELHNNYINKKNLYQIPNNKPIFEWKSPNNFIFDTQKKTCIDLSHNLKFLNLIFQSKFTISTYFEMNKFEEKVQTIFSVGGCNGYSLSISDQTEIMIDGFCGKRIYNSGIYVPLKHPIKLNISYDSQKIVFYLNDKKYREIFANLKIDYPRFIYTIGCTSESNLDLFSGKIEYVNIFNVLLDGNNLNNHPSIKTENNNLVKFRKGFDYEGRTIDLRPCLTKCLFLPIPGTEGSPEEPDEAVKPEPKIEENNTNDDNGDDNKSNPTIKNMSNIILLKCVTKAKELFKETSLEKIRVKCPSGCNKYDSNIFGNVIYTENSSICRSAIHAGMIKKSGGVFSVKKIEPLSFYLGVYSNGIQSTGINTAEFSFIFEEAPNITLVTCETPANTTDFPEVIGMKYQVKCPENCDITETKIFGNEVYSSESSICKSAIHSGVISRLGGEVTFIFIPGKRLYLGKTKFGIKSFDSKGSKTSIRFFVAYRGSYIKYKEQFIKGSLLNNWIIKDSDDAVFGPSNWNIVKSKFPTKSKYIINQSSKIKINQKKGNSIEFASIILLKNSQFINTLFRVTFYFNNLNPVGIILKYINDDNYYAIVLNSVIPYRMLFIKRMNGKNSVLGMSRLELKQNIFYIFTIQIYMRDVQKIKVYMQMSEKKINHLLFNIKDNLPIIKGGIGFATNGNNNFFITNIFLDNFIPNEGSKGRVLEKRTFEQILQENTESKREKFCKALFKESPKKYICKEYHNFCQLKCNEYFPKRENILNYNCYKTCVKDSQNKLKINESSSKDQNETKKKKRNGVWDPKKNDKCDYKPEEANIGWVPCTIIKVKNADLSNKLIYINYTVNGKIKMLSFIYPSPLISKCGTKILSRTDCK